MARLTSTLLLSLTALTVGMPHPDTQTVTSSLSTPTSTISTSASSASTAATPGPATTGSMNTTITYYTGSVPSFGYVSDGACGAGEFAVYKGTIEANKCQRFTVSAIGLQRLPDRNCGLVLFEGSDSCESAVNGTHAQWIALPPSDVSTTGGSADSAESTCVGTGVFDGGRFKHVSGFWTCL